VRHFIVPFTAPLGIPREAAVALLGPPFIMGTLVCELGLPWLLRWPRTRLAACVLGLLFHLPMMALGVLAFPLLILSFYPLCMRTDELRAILEQCQRRPSALRGGLTGIAGLVGAFLIVNSSQSDKLYETTTADGWQIMLRIGLLILGYFGGLHVFGSVVSIMLRRSARPVLIPAG
jgi:hypothetical protein